MLQIGNPGNKGGGRKPDLFMERAEELVNDPTVWDVQLARAKAGELKILEFAAGYVKGKPKEHIETSGELVIRIVKEGKPRAGA